MIRPIMQKRFFLKQPSELATAADVTVARDLADTLTAHRATCVGMAANMIGERKRIIAVIDDDGSILVMLNPYLMLWNDPYDTEEGCLSLEGMRPAPLDGKKQERARRKCLETLLPNLEERGIGEVVLESRGAATDKLDLNYAKYAKGSKLVKSISISHEEGSAEPRLWIADQVVGAMGDYLTQTSNWKHWKSEWEAMGPRIERINVSL